MSERRLIDANALLSQAFSTISSYDAVLVEDIINSPTIEAEPVKTAKWELVRYDPDYLVWSGKCTNCNEKHESTENIAKLPFCPNCGAQMQGEMIPQLIITEEEQP